MSCSEALWFLVTIAMVTGGRDVNDLRGPFNFQCPSHHVISEISSIYEHRMADRRWKFICRESEMTTFCTESGYIGQFHQPTNFMCPGNSKLVGINSYYDEKQGDRRYDFKCCNVGNSKASKRTCQVSDYANEYGGKLTLKVPDDNAIDGVSSSYDDRRKDRVWKFRICSL